MQKRILNILLIIFLIILVGCNNYDNYHYGNHYITLEESNYIANFLSDYISYFDEFPNQFYLYNQDKVISLGNILFVLLQKESGINDQFIIDRDFELIDKDVNIEAAYKMALSGKIPKQISGKELSLYFGSQKAYVPSDLNDKNRKIEIAFTFDIESGRYVHNFSGISPCEDDNYSFGLTVDELNCNLPEYMAWMTPRDDNLSYLDYPYPAVSGILGFKEILDYSERYGLPMTNFIVKKDILAFEALDKGVVDRARQLVDGGLFEVGSHTRYHTHLGLVDEDMARTELEQSRLFLEDYFNTSVVGFRAPYLSVLGDGDDHVKALKDAGYGYYSSYTDGSDMNKEWNMDKYVAYTSVDEFKKLMDTEEYIITLDHPWNLVYDNGDILVENPDLKDNYRKILLMAISEGGIPILLKDLET